MLIYIITATLKLVIALSRSLFSSSPPSFLPLAIVKAPVVARSPREKLVESEAEN